MMVRPLLCWGVLWFNQFATSFVAVVATTTSTAGDVGRSAVFAGRPISDSPENVPSTSISSSTNPTIESASATTNNHPNDNNITMASTGTAAARRLVGKLKPESSLLMVCDIQTKFRPLVWRGETVVKTAQYMTSVAKALSIPIVATQQYTKVFGPTVPEVFATPEDLEACPIFEKKRFSMMTDEVKAHVEPLQRTSYLLVGIEAHVCLQQTALDLLEQGKDVHVIVDGVSSQQPIDREIALQRMVQAGAFLTTAQSAAFMLMQTADHENFKAVSKLTVEHMKLENEFNTALLKK